MNQSGLLPPLRRYALALTLSACALLPTYQLSVQAQGMDWMMGDEELKAQQDLDQTLVKAQKLYDQKQYGKALPLYAALYEKLPDSHDLALQFAYCLFKDQQPRMSLTVLNRVALQAKEPGLVQQAKDQIAIVIKSDINAKGYQTAFVDKLQKTNFSVTLKNVETVLGEIGQHEDQVYERNQSFFKQLKQVSDPLAALKQIRVHSQLLSAHLGYLQTQRDRLNVYGAKLMQYKHRIIDVSKSLHVAHLIDAAQKQGKYFIDQRFGTLVLTQIIGYYQVGMSGLHLANAEISGLMLEEAASDKEIAALKQLRKQNCSQASVGMMMLSAEIATLYSQQINAAELRKNELELKGSFAKVCRGV